MVQNNTRQLKVLELFSGTECLSDAFRARGHECFTVDWDKKFPSSLHIDIMQLTAEMILEKFGRPDIAWIGTDCSSYSVAAIGHHRRKNPVTGFLEPKTEKALFADNLNRHVLDVIRQLNPHFFFIENPVGGLRKMDFMQGIPRHTITYCQYGFPYRKATDIWTNHPRTEFKPPCRNGDPCHEPAPRGTKKGLQALQGTELRSKYPPELCNHIVDICEKYIDLEPLPAVFGRTIIQKDLFDNGD